VVHKLHKISESLHPFDIAYFGYYRMATTDTLAVSSLNVAYDPRIEDGSPFHFHHRWPAIQDELRHGEVILLQEVHEDWLPKTRAFAAALGCRHFEQMYHTYRKTYLVTLVRFELYSSHAVHQAPNTYTTSLAVTVQKNGDRLTLFNVHLPLDLKMAGERMASTTGFLNVASADKSAILGDWNTLPGKGDSEQLQAAGDCGRIIPWDFDGAPETTVWGYPIEDPRYQQYTTLSVLDRLFVHGPTEVLSAVCHHKFIEVGGAQMALSDHLPCHVVFSMAAPALTAEEPYKQLKRAWLELDLQFDKSDVPKDLEAVLRADIRWRVQLPHLGKGDFSPLDAETLVFDSVIRVAQAISASSDNADKLDRNGILPGDGVLVANSVGMVWGRHAMALHDEFCRIFDHYSASVLMRIYMPYVLQLAGSYARAAKAAAAAAVAAVSTVNMD